MKKILLILALISAVGLQWAFAQLSDENWDLLLVREDVVNPSMTISYEASLDNLTHFMNENKVKEVNYITQLQDDIHYSHITVLNDLNEIEDGITAYISGAKPSDEFKLIWNELNESLESYRYYVVKYDKENSFVPDGKVWLEQAPYRKWNYYYFKPGTEKQVNQILAAWKTLYEQKGIDNGYRIFRGVIGLEQPVIIFTNWAKSPLEHQQNLQNNMALLGEEGSVLWMAMLELARKIEVVEGWFLPQYSYQPE